MNSMCGWSTGTANRCNGSCPSKGGVANFDTAGELLLHAFSAPTALRDDKIVVPGGMARGHSPRHNNFVFASRAATRNRGRGVRQRHQTRDDSWLRPWPGREIARTRATRVRTAAAEVPSQGVLLKRSIKDERCLTGRLLDRKREVALRIHGSRE